MRLKGERGFTIVEMLMVIGVLGILVGLITTAASTAIRQSRIKRTMAMQAVLQAGLETYHAQMGKWPDELQSATEKIDSHRNTKAIYLDDGDAAKVFQEIIRESTKPGASPMLDMTGLMVARGPEISYSSKANVQGIDFTLAIVNGKHRKKIYLKEMSFGYVEQGSGYFRPFIIKYNFDTDGVTVLTQNEGSQSAHDFRQEMVLLGKRDQKYKDITWSGKPDGKLD